MTPVNSLSDGVELLPIHEICESEQQYQGSGCLIPSLLSSLVLPVIDFLQLCEYFLGLMSH